MTQDMPTWQELDQQVPLYSNLAKPFKLGNVEVKNRIVMSSITRTRGTPVDHVNDTVVE